MTYGRFYACAGVSHQAVKDGKRFTQSPGWSRFTPSRRRPRDECLYSAWLLRHEASLRFDYDPDAALSEKTGEHGFRGQGRSGIPRGQPTGFARAW
jgi:hypothetical protein